MGKSFIALCLVASVLRARADVHVGVATVMCNCAAQVDTYNAYNSAVADCAAYMGAGAASCVANVLGHLSGDGRSVDFASLRVCGVMPPPNVPQPVQLMPPISLILVLGLGLDPLISTLWMPH